MGKRAVSVGIYDGGDIHIGVEAGTTKGESGKRISLVRELHHVL